MKKVTLILLSVFMLTVVGCKENNKKADEKMDDDKEMMNEQEESMEEEMPMKKDISFALESKSNSDATGKVMFSQEGDIVTMRASLSGLDAGTHAIHIHEKADCSADDGKSAGGHWNPTFENHGKWGDTNGYHKGDIGNFEADANGNGSVSMQTDEWCIGCGDDKKDILGKAIIVHQGEDDFTSQPSGDAGARVSCGGIIQ